MPKGLNKASKIELPHGWVWRFNHGSKRWAQCHALDGSIMAAVSTSLNTRTREWSDPLITLRHQNFALSTAALILGVANEAVCIAKALMVEVSEPKWECRGCGSTAWEVTEDQQKWCADCARPADWQPELEAALAAKESAS